MTGRERLIAALRSEPVDELPVSLQGMSPFSPSRTHRDSGWDILFDQYAETGDIFHFFTPVTAPLAASPVRQKTESLLKTADYEDRRITFKTPAGDLTMIRRDQLFTGATIKHAVESTADIAAAKWILSQEFTIDAQATRQVYEDLLQHPHLMPLLQIDEPIEAVVGLLGAERFSLFLIEALDELIELVDIASKRTLHKLAQTLETGIEPVVWVGGAEWITPPYAGPGLFRTLIVPHLEKMVGIAHEYGCIILHHCHGRIGGVLDQLLAIGIDGTHPFEAPPSGDITPDELKTRIDRPLCCVGNLQLDDMLRAPRRKLQDKVEELLAVFSDWRQGGFILSVTGTPTCRAAPPEAIENYLYLLECKKLYK